MDGIAMPLQQFSVEAHRALKVFLGGQHPQVQKALQLRGGLPSKFIGSSNFVMENKYDDFCI
jgi:hypothetical protein